MIESHLSNLYALKHRAPTGLNIDPYDAVAVLSKVAPDSEHARGKTRATDGSVRPFGRAALAKTLTVCV